MFRLQTSDTLWETAENMDHEVAWNWLWENVERIISHLGWGYPYHPSHWTMTSY